MSAFHDNALIGASGQQGYQISRSVRLRSSASAYLNRTPATPTNQAIWTWSAWVKRGSGFGSAGFLFAAGTVSSNDAAIYFETDNTLIISKRSGYTLATSQVLRDPSAWYHIQVAYDSTQATSSNRIKLYINGSQVTAFGTATYPTLNETSSINSTAAAYIGRRSDGYYFDGYLTEVNFIDGQALTPSSFGETDTTTGVWKPKKYAGTYGTNGFYLNFSDNSGATATTIGKDYSGNGNNWTPNNISVTAGVTYDSMIDVPTTSASASNYCVLNPLNKFLSNVTVLDGNLGISTSATNVGVAGTIGVSSGKWYWETTFTNASGVPSIGAATAAWGKTYVGYTGSIGYHGNGSIYNNGSNVQSGLASYTSGDVIGVALNLDAGSITFYKNNTQIGTTVTGLTGEWFPAVAGQTSSTLSCNFGQRPFSYTPPTGFVALNTQNLPAPTISNGAQYMAATTYTGNGSTQTISNAVNGVSFQPDWVWVKSRSNAYGNYVNDVIRGSTTYLETNTTGAEGTQSNTITSFNSSGFSLGNNLSYNGSGATFVGWQWKAGGTAVSNTAGTITSSVSANPTAGFSVVTFTTNNTAGATIGHGLGVAPSMIIMKYRGLTANWVVYHKNMSATPQNGYLNLNTTAAYATSTDAWNNTAPTSSVITMGAGAGSAASTNYGVYTSVAYCFAEVAGYSKFGSYTGNGSSTNGPFTYTGFRPRWILFKRTDSTSSWTIFDTARNPYNLTNAYIQANASDAEAVFSDIYIDILSNGFKQRGTNNSLNVSGGTYVYMAFCENPFKLSLAR